MSSEHPNQQQADFATITCSEQLAVPVGAAWQRIGDFNIAGKFLNVSSRLLFGDGALGSIRLIAESVVEIMVGSGEHSYTYFQTVGPMASFAYHGCVSLRPTGPNACILDYTIIYNQQAMAPSQRLEQFDRIKNRFQGAAVAMKNEAER